MGKSTGGVYVCNWLTGCSSRHARRAASAVCQTGDVRLNTTKERCVCVCLFVGVLIVLMCMLSTVTKEYLGQTGT